MASPKLHVTREGSGPVIVLSHALGCSTGIWDGVAAQLKDRFTIVRYDHRGQGRSEVTPGPYTMDMLADDAAEVIRSEAGGPVHFVGVSMGGMTAQALAARHPQLVRSITVANASSWYDETARAAWQARIDTVEAKGIAAVAEGAMARWFTPGFRAAQPAVVAGLRARLEAADPAGYVASCRAVQHIDFRASNRDVRCPALVVAGTFDEATPPAMSEVIAQAISGAKLQRIDAAHLSVVEQPEAFAWLVDGFIAGLR